MKVVNLTPHEITVEAGDGTRTFPPSGKVARVENVADKFGIVSLSLDNELAWVTYKPGRVEGLPKPKPNTIFLVSAMVLAAVKGRDDLYAPDTGPESAIRDEAGRIIAVRRLVKGGKS